MGSMVQRSRWRCCTSRASHSWPDVEPRTVQVNRGTCPVSERAGSGTVQREASCDSLCKGYGSRVAVLAVAFFERRRWHAFHVLRQVEMGALRASARMHEASEASARQAAVSRPAGERRAACERTETGAGQGKHHEARLATVGFVSCNSRHRAAVWPHGSERTMKVATSLQAILLMEATPICCS